MEELLYRYNPWWEGEYKLKGIIERPSLTNLMNRSLNSQEIVFLTGLRRIGKTTLLRLFIKGLIEQEGITPDHIFYVSIDDYLLSKKSILELVEEYRKLHKISFKEKVFLFLDEIAYQDNFELQLKNLYDHHNIKIFAASSSASILKSKKPYLTGRNLVIEVLPIDFEEYLDFRQIKIDKADSHLTERYFEEYLNTGGLPEYVLRQEIDYLKELIDDIIYKDIASFHKIKNIQILKDFFVLLMERAGKIVSINKMAHILNISPDTAKRFLEMFSQTYLVYLVERRGKTNEKILSPKKLYAADLGIRTFFTGFRDKGSLFENYVYLKIKNYRPRYIYEDGLEIDFITDNNELIEVKYNSALTGKQLALFERVNARKKFIIRNLNELREYLSGQISL